jgi:hypothetical protein
MHSSMQNRRTPFYLEVKSPSETSSEIASIALFHPENGFWFYAEVVDFDRADCSQFFVESVQPKLRRIPGTKFVTRADLPGEMLRWLLHVVQPLGDACDPLPEVILRGPSARAGDLATRPLLAAAEAEGAQLNLTFRECRPDPSLLSDFYSHAGGEAKARHNGLADAVGLAISDRSREENINLSEIRHFEFLMGSKPAMSLRAWVRRLESAKVASVSESAAMAGASAAS